MKLKFFVFIFLAGIISNMLFAQFSQQGPKLVGTGFVGGSDQGYAVAISSDGNTAIVGGISDNGYIGAAWIFTRSSGTWSQQGPKLVGTGAVGTSYQGSSVAISSDGNTAIVGGFEDNGNLGAVWIFNRSGGVWTQQGPKLVGSGMVGNFVFQGASVTISSDGNTVIEGGYGDNANTGAVWIFTRSGGVWTQQGSKLVGTGAIGISKQGISAAISSDGNTAIVGGFQDNGSLGAVWIFTRSGSVWTQQGSKLVGSGAVGNYVEQGSSVAISSDGNTVIEGGYGDNANAGAVWIFTRSGGAWTQQGSKLVGTSAVGNSYQGSSVAISSDGNTAIEGGPYDNFQAGAVWVFTRSGSFWTQLGPKIVGSGNVGNAFQGASVAISSDGNTAIEGGFKDNPYVGAVWVFTRSNYRFHQSRNNLNKPILGNQTTLDTINVATDVSSYYVSNVNVTLDSITYPVDGDLEISLIHATNTDTLVYQVGDSGANFIGTVLSDSASALISNGTAPFTGIFKPAKQLSQFLNFDPEGVWILKVYNRNTGHTGTLEAWTLTIDLSPNLISVTNISQEIPKGFSLSQNYPNPFNPSTKIKFDISKLSYTSVKVYDLLGRETETLVNEQLKPGTYEVNFDGSRYSSGVYFYKLVVGDNTNNAGFIETKKMILLK